MKKIAMLFCLLYSIISVHAQVALEDNQKLREASGTVWYANPWLWIAGVVLFVLIFLFILRKATRNKTNT